MCPPAPTPSPCPSDSEFLALSDNRLPEKRAASLKEHLLSCSACTTLYKELVEENLASRQSGHLPLEDQLAHALLQDRSSARTEPLRPDSRLSRGGVVGRYLVLSLLGRGGMGTVYAAYDPDLHRRVALKLLRVTSSTQGARERLLREARALGRLSHPNVVQIYDVGEHQGDVFLAMELVEGETLDSFCHSTPKPSWKEILSSYLDAARGIEAAHKQGLVHRDIKPSNILKGRDGRVRVADFGLVTGNDEDDESLAPMAQTRPSDGLTLGDGLTAEGALLGTPLYMAPEQHQSSHVSPASDQYSLCAALYEGLYGTPPCRPEPIDTPTDLLVRKLAGPGPAPQGSQVPRWVHQALSKGLAPKPQDRYPSLSDLIDSLTSDPDAHRRDRRLRAGLVFGSGVLFAIGAAGWIKSGTFSNPCAHPEQELLGTWDTTIKEQMQNAFLGTKRIDAPDTFERVSRQLDGYTSNWSQMRGQVCSAARVATRKRDLLELRENCLDRRLTQLHALTTLLAEKPDPGILDKAVPAVRGLLPISECDDDELLRARVRPPDDPELRARVSALQPQVDRLEALYTAGRYKEVVELSEPLLVQARAIPYPELVAKVAWLVGQTRDQLGDYEGAKAILKEGALRAAEAKDAPMVAQCWDRIFFILVDREVKLDQTSALEELIPTLVAQAGDEKVRASWLTSEGILLGRQGNNASAKTIHEQALSIAERAYGPDDLALAEVLTSLAKTLRSVGDYPGSIANNQRALSIRQKVLGPRHPIVALSLNNLAAAWATAGDYSQALVLIQQALQIDEELLGKDNLSLWLPLVNAGELFGNLGRYTEAVQTLERCLAIRDKALGPDNPDNAAPLLELGYVQIEMGDNLQALASFERARSLLERKLGPGNPALGPALAGSGWVKVKQGKLADAFSLLERAKALMEKAGNPNDEDMERALLGMGELELARDQPQEAVTILKPLLGSAQSSVMHHAQLLLAEALWKVGSERAKARDLVEETRVYYERIHHAPGQAEATRWLEEHPLGQ